MRVLSLVYDSGDVPAHVEQVLAAIESRGDDVDVVDVADLDPADARREAMLTIKSGVGIGTPPEALFDEEGRPDFSVGALITEQPNGRRSLHVGSEMAGVLDGG